WWRTGGGGGGAGAYLSRMVLSSSLRRRMVSRTTMPTPMARAPIRAIVPMGEDFLAGISSVSLLVFTLVAPVVSIGAGGAADSAGAEGGAAPSPLDGGFAPARGAAAAASAGFVSALISLFSSTAGFT